MLRPIESSRAYTSMGRESRHLAEARYDVHRVNQRILKELELV